MKRFLIVLVALMMIFAIVGCNNGSTGGRKGPTGPTGPTDPDPPKDVTLVLADNFQYGDGYQGLVDALDFISGRISTGDEFVLKIKFTADRDLEDELYVGLVDPTEAANYWQPLSWPGGDDDPDLIEAEDDDGIIKKRPGNYCNN